MEEYKKRILFREFDFLGKVREMAAVKKFDDVKIKVIDHNLLERKGVLEGEEFEPTSWRRGQIFFVVQKGEVTALPYNGFFRDQFTNDSYSAGNLAEEMFKLEITSPEFIVEVDINEQLGFVKETFEHKIFIYRDKGITVEVLTKKIRQAADDEMRMANAKEYVGHTVRLIKD